jgi:hypothetical protein
MMMPLNGGPAVTLAMGLNTPQEIALDRNTVPTTVFWVEFGGSIKRVSAGGGTITTMATGQSGANGIAVSLSTVYWTNSATGTVMKLPSNVAGPTMPVQINTIAGKNPHGITLDASNVYWANGGDAVTASTVIGASVTTGVNTLLYTGVAGMPGLQAIVADPISGKLFFTDYLNSAILSVDTVGANLTTVATTGAPFGLAIGGSTLYFPNTYTNGGIINKIGTNGVGKAVVAPGQSGPRYLAIDATSVYWTNFGDGTVKKANK